MTDLSKMELLIVVICLRANGQVSKVMLEEEVKSMQIQFSQIEIAESCKKLIDCGLVLEDKTILKISDPIGYEFLDSIKNAVLKNEK